MWKTAIGIVVVAAATGAGASYYTTLRSQGFNMADKPVVTSTERATPQAQSTQPEKSEPVRVSYAGRSHRIKADRQGHFITTARMNGRKVEVLVDTGATSVAINKSTARRLGLRLIPSDFKYKVNTANGSVKAATATIDRIDLGRVTVTDVRVAVLPDKSLDGTLLGMSFLNELRSFEFRNGELLLTQ